jgi:hypothetical protein
MFRFFRKKQELSPMQELLNLAIDDLEDEWINYAKIMRFNDGASLSTHINNFARPLVESFKNKYLTLYQYSGSIFWHTVSTAIMRSNTHPKNEVNNAFRELDAKYN